MTRRQRLILLIGFTLALNTVVFAQPTLTPPADVPTGRIFTLYGDFKVFELQGDVPPHTMFDLILYSTGNDAIARQRVGKGGRYSFNNIVEGNYVIGVELDNVEITRVAIHIAQRKHEPMRQDMQMAWTPSVGAKRSALSAPDSYTRTPQNRKLFEQALKEINKNELPKAVATLRSVVAADPKDYQSWNELGSIYFIQKDFTAAENSYAKAIEAKPQYTTAYVSLGRVRLAQKKHEDAIAALQSAVKTDPQSALTNYFLGEANFAAGKESIGVGYMNEALKLDPVGMANAHLRLANVHHLAGRKDLAAIEYNEFLKKKPEYPDAQRLRDYIIANNPRRKRNSNPSPTPNP